MNVSKFKENDEKLQQLSQCCTEEQLTQILNDILKSSYSLIVSINWFMAEKDLKQW